MSDLDDALAHARAATISFDDWCMRMRRQKTYAYTSTEWYKAALALERAAHPSPSPPPALPTLRRIPTPAYGGSAVIVSSTAEAIQALNTKLGGELVLRGSAVQLPDSGRWSYGRNGQGLRVFFEQGARFVGGPVGTRLYGFWLKAGACFTSFYDVDVTNDGGTGLGITGGAHDLVVTGKAHKVGGTCLFVPANYGSDVWNLDVDIDASDCGNDLSQDPHAEKGTGLHPAYIGAHDSVDLSHVVRDSKFTIVAHDCDTGSVQIGEQIHNVELWIDARRLNKAATSQVAGSAFQPWGRNVRDVTVHYLYAEDCQGRVVEPNTLSAGPVTVEYARATRCALNPKLAGDYWGSNPNVSYVDVAKL